MQRKLVIAHDINESLLQQVKDVIPDWDIIMGGHPEVWTKHIKDAEVIAGWRTKMVEPCLHNESSKLRWIQSWSAGVDSYPLDTLAARDIYLTSANGVHAYPISESIFALMLALTRKIATYVKQQQDKKWDEANLNLEVHEKTIGIIGVGAIGKETAKIAKAFGMEVIGVRHSDKPEPFVDTMVTTEQLNAILPSCDYVVVTVPLTQETHHLFGEEQFNLMKPTAFFINIGRGEVVDEQALTKALETEQIAGAGLDVFENEPLDNDSPLWLLDNVIITPHSAGSTEHYTKRVIEDLLIPNLKEYIKGKAPSINLVDYHKGY
ncbi:phosphoglycerate dehydrogenase-like enzyme [Pullulanibacillus pueri]|uniref:3-phosphoglycerate dehydrogenase n=1 Tax=Pullulanibacillus pueri TaxID=1437324 RepID=A0A8J3EPM1_9BACL|nr:D-2-hydroxyacid dehydrogenase [Pullulanibacillus pueri]MBM7684108.1 phosphoglycerate dehydrogenase-like enzyme [Pullulanibacillus pueri]GGH88675.1 3-phosphoglycerate dehydrogenase [Pullulanibacillus pueri]